MAIATVTKKRTKEQLLKDLIKEVKRLQFQVSLLSLPEEDIDEYDDPEEIEKSYQRAIKQYPPKI